MDTPQPQAYAQRLQLEPDSNRLSTLAYAQGFQIDSNQLLHGTRELIIRHGGETYRLRHTRNDKLILTK
ncbi:MAG: hemin uptake protein HemP [Lysobacter sp.]